jgi:hypothetical protein
MPPDLDIYGLTRRRDEITINRFIEAYVDKLKSEDRGREELMLEPLDSLIGSSSIQSYDWAPALSLTHIIGRGLEYPRRAFVVYLSPKRENHRRAILSFTTDNMVIFGLSIDDEGQKTENIIIAKGLLERLITEFECHVGIIAVESPPPASEAELFNMKDDPLTVLIARRE